MYSTALRSNEHLVTDAGCSPALQPSAVYFVQQRHKGYHTEIRRSNTHERATDTIARATPNFVFFSERITRWTFTSPSRSTRHVKGLLQLDSAPLPADQGQLYY